MAYYTFNLEKRQEIRKANGFEDRFVIGHVGRFHYVKNHAFMLEVLKELRAYSNEYCLMLVGDGELKDSIKSKAQELGLLDSVKFMGVRKDVPDMLQAMDCFIFPSFNEGLGIGLIEAQASGLPCVANSEGIIPLAKISDLVSFLPISNGPEIWAKYIDKLRQNNLKRSDMSQAVKNAGFDIQEVTLWLTNFYCNFKKREHLCVK